MEIQPKAEINGFSIDTRNLGDGQLFVAIKDKGMGMILCSRRKTPVQLVPW